MFKHVMLAYGGVDAVVVTAGIFVPPDKTGHIDDKLWAPHVWHQRYRRVHRRR